MENPDIPSSHSALVPGSNQNSGTLLRLDTPCATSSAIRLLLTKAAGQPAAGDPLFPFHTAASGCTGQPAPPHFRKRKASSFTADFTSCQPLLPNNRRQASGRRDSGRCQRRQCKTRQQSQKRMPQKTNDPIKKPVRKQVHAQPHSRTPCSLTNPPQNSPPFHIMQSNGKYAARQ